MMDGSLSRVIPLIFIPKREVMGIINAFIREEVKGREN